MKHSSKKIKIAVLYGDHSHGAALINSLQKVADTFSILIIDDLAGLNRDRYKRYGFVKGVGQKLFIKYSKRLKRKSRNRIEEIKENLNLDYRPVSPDFKIGNVHDKRLPELINKESADLVVMNCASIIPNHVLDRVKAPFLNIHGGITPLYRGIFGAYWALRDGNEHLIGSTIHKVDQGIDTGEILNQTFFTVTATDNFSTYNYLSFGYALEGLHSVIQYYKKHNKLPEPMINDLASGFYSHPTLFGYFFHRIFRGIK